MAHKRVNKIKKYKNGTLKKTLFLEGEKECGQSTTFYENGYISAVGVHDNGVKVGRWVYFWNTGELNKIVDYSDGNESIVNDVLDVSKLVRSANCSYDWRRRLMALQQIQHIDCPQRKDVIARLALHDKVYHVKETAFRVAQALNIGKNGKPIRLTKKNIRYTPKDFNKIFSRVRRECKMETFDLLRFHNKLEQINPEMYDVMLFEKGIQFDKWLENTFRALPKPQVTI